MEVFVYGGWARNVIRGWRGSPFPALSHHHRVECRWLQVGVRRFILFESDFNDNESLLWIQG